MRSSFAIRAVALCLFAITAKAAGLDAEASAPEPEILLLVGLGLLAVPAFGRGRKKP